MRRRSILALCLLMLPVLPGESGVFQSLEVVLAGPTELGVAALEIDGSTDLSALAPLGGIEADLAGDQIYLAVNADRATPGATRMIRFDKATIVLSQGTVGTVSEAVSASTGNPYLTNVKLAGDTHNPNNHAGDFLLGMSSDPNTGDIYLAAQDGVASKALLRIASGIGSASAVVEFAATDTDTAQIPAAYRLSPNYCPSFSSTMMGPES
ncbi:MAG: hypothetical protein HUU16_08555, partial [Candidatus Omnitrophica bacterium]|nr:hypothetical protein [Candidatus Omnitrophota bacterium]